LLPNLINMDIAFYMLDRGSNLRFSTYLSQEINFIAIKLLNQKLENITSHPNVKFSN
jgi:hypothetical protein